MVAEELTRLPIITDVFDVKDVKSIERMYGQEDDIVLKSRDQLVVSCCMPGF